jgi:ubiquinone/menaquinone biosynthesis C-methylase UbiE
MSDDPDTIAASFDQRAATYHGNDWHRRSAERLVELGDIRAGMRVLDAGAGTGFAALPAARKGASVVAVDVSRGMLAQARESAGAAGIDAIEFIEADATHLPQLDAGSFDRVICATAIHYMPVARTLREWRRLLRPDGRLGFSTMHADSPKAAGLFRRCAARFGVALTDASAVLGTPEACRAELAAAGFRAIDVIEEPIAFAPIDLSVAWESNVRAPANAAVLALDEAALVQLRAQYLRELTAAVATDRDALVHVDMLYALASAVTDRG